MAITTNGQYAEYNDVKDTFPVSTSLTGTVSSANNGEFIVGSGTLFTTELQTGEWLYVADQDDFRQIRSISSDTELYLYSAFSTALSGDTARRIPRQTYKSISWEVTAAADAEINNISQAAGSSATLPFDAIARMRPDPILINATGAVVKVQLTY